MARAHPWDLDATEARRIYRTLASRVVLTGAAQDATTVVGLDVAYEGGSERLAAAAVVFDVASLEPVEHATVIGRAWTQIPSIGCAKTLFIGNDPVVGSNRGDRASIIEDGERVGIALRTRTQVKPVYVSPGDHDGYDVTGLTPIDGVR